MSWFAVISGIGVAAAVAGGARALKIDPERGFYPTILVVIASYFVLFAVMANEAVVIELMIAGVFVAIAPFGATTHRRLAGAGIVLHWLFDLLHPWLIGNSGVPQWWPTFCASVDVALGPSL